MKTIDARFELAEVTMTRALEKPMDRISIGKKGSI